MPCDTPNFPADLVARLAAALVQADAEIAMAAAVEDGQLRTQPVFCLLKADLLGSLVHYLQGGQRKIDRWTALHRCVGGRVRRPAAFFNANTLAELQQLQRAAALSCAATRGDQVVFEIEMVGNLDEIVLGALRRSSPPSAAPRPCRWPAISPSGSATTVGRPASACSRIDRFSGSAPR